MKCNLLAFVHIEKAAGTTLNHILRHNYFMHYMDVSPFHKASEGVFGVEDFKIASRIVPCLQCISGHSVKPFGSIEQIDRNIQYITLLRDPVSRYLSQYRYWVNHLSKPISFEEYLDLDKPGNFQTKKLSIQGDVAQAIDIMEKRFLLVGIVEEFDEFLILLQKKLQSNGFDPSYRVQNSGKAVKSIIDEFKIYEDKIIENNKKDIELYRYVKEVLLIRYRQEYGESLILDIEDFVQKNRQFYPAMFKRYVDYVQRKLYVNPMVGVTRVLHGLPYKGSY